MRTISEGQAIEFLQVHFGFNSPISFEDVKKKFKKESKRLHPDCEGGDEESFKALNGAFMDLQKLYNMGSRLFDAEPLDAASKDQAAAPSMPRTLVDGKTPLSELGLGLGPTTNGRECLRCEQRGYTLVTEHGRGKCCKCEGHGYHASEYPCRPCGGSGKFTQRRSERIVDCRSCNGTGKFTHPFNTQRCEACYGSGKGRTEQVVSIYALRCTECQGTGETEVWNPVIPKGRLFVYKSADMEQPSPTPPVPQKAPQPKKAPIPKEPEPDRMQDLLRELREKGVGGKR